jgi:hypothetical protein
MQRVFVGWCREGRSDKVWVCIRLKGSGWDGTYATVWGRRGRRLQHKIINHSNFREMNKMISAKIQRGYREIDEDHLDQVYPEFDEDLKKTEVWALLTA